MFDNWWDNQQKNKVMAEYIWIDSTGQGMLSKSRTLDTYQVSSIKDIPVWNYDGSSTGQAPTDKSELVLKPVFFCVDPFRGEQGFDNAILVLCISFKWEQTCISQGDSMFNMTNYILKPASCNYRPYCYQVWDQIEYNEMWFGIEQEYLISNFENPLDIPNHYCMQGMNMKKGRALSERHYQMCLKAGLSIHGTNSEVVHNQWEYQIGICKGLEAADQLWMSRFILFRVAEQFDAMICLDPKPIVNQNGSGAHLNWSTSVLRQQAAFAQQGKANSLVEEIEQIIHNLDKYHEGHIQYFGKGNEARLTGTNETSNYDKLSFGVDNRNCSIRVPTTSIENTRYLSGYIEDRRPSANMDPYVVCTLTAQAVLCPNQPNATEYLINACLV